MEVSEAAGEREMAPKCRSLPRDVGDFRPVAKGESGGSRDPPARQSKALLTHCFGYTVGLTFQSPKIKPLPPDGSSEGGIVYISVRFWLTLFVCLLTQ